MIYNKWEMNYVPGVPKNFRIHAALPSCKRTFFGTSKAMTIEILLELRFLFSLLIPYYWHSGPLTRVEVWRAGCSLSFIWCQKRRRRAI